MQHPIKMLLEEGHSLKVLQWLEAPEGQLFSDWLKARQMSYHIVQRTSSDTVALFRAQGALEVIDCLLALPELIRDFHRDVKTGKVTKPSTSPHISRTAVLQPGISREVIVAGPSTLDEITNELKRKEEEDSNVVV